MRIEGLRQETRRLRKKIRKGPRILRFRGKRVVHLRDWKWGDWSRLPDRYMIFLWGTDKFPQEWLADYVALLEKLQDPDLGKHLCISCVVDKAGWVKREIDGEAKYWEQNGGEAAKEERYRMGGERTRLAFLKQDAMREVKWRFFNELGGANNRACEVVNFFKCPYGEERQDFLDKGRLAYEIWDHIEWYDEHWNPNIYSTPAASARKWYHYGEPQIIDVTSFDDIDKALDDGRFKRIVEEHEKYLKEMDATGWHPNKSRKS
jgi:hypothetical protein